MSKPKEIEYCPNCNTELKSGWGSNSLIEKAETEFINEMLSNSADAYCGKCSSDAFGEANIIYHSKLKELNTYLRKYIKFIPIVTTHTPHGWEYKSGGIVTGQSVTGTGLISEFTSDFTDFFGGQSGSFNKKLAKGENMCFDQLRAKALKQNANAIIATDIDYGEAGAAKGMLMVCAAGTAVKVTNLDVFGSKKEIIEKLANLTEELEYLHKFKEVAK